MTATEIVQLIVAGLGITAVIYSWWQSSASRLAEQAKRLSELTNTLERIGPPESLAGDDDPGLAAEHRERVIDLKAQTRVAIAGYSERIKRSHGSWFLVLAFSAFAVTLVLYGTDAIARSIRAHSPYPEVAFWLGALAILAAVFLLGAAAITAHRILEFRRHCRAAGINVPALWRDISGLTGSAWSARRDRGHA